MTPDKERIEELEKQVAELQTKIDQISAIALALDTILGRTSWRGSGRRE